MKRTFIVTVDDSLRNAQQDIDELETKWGAEELPKQHGDLIDRNLVLDAIMCYIRLCVDELTNTPAIIPANKGNKSINPKTGSKQKVDKEKEE